jgi:serine/threonine protein kinase
VEYSNRLAITCYKTIAVINESHNIYLVQHQETAKIYIKKVLDVYNSNIYEHLQQHPIPGIPKIIDHYEEEQQLTIIEEYISGESLLEQMQTHQLTSEVIIRYMTDLCEILERLHAQNPPIVHRDIKPSNIIITSYDRVILLDFNAAKFFTDSNTNDTVLLGTRGYAAPEQYGFGSSSPQTDIYALGILLKELSASMQVPCNMFDKIIHRCTQMNPSDRFGSVTELKESIYALNPSVKPANGCYFRSYKQPTAAEKISLVLQKFLPPGYRTRTPWKMVLASLVYLFLCMLSLSTEIKDTYGAVLWFERIYILIVMLAIIFVCFNYLNIQRLMPLCKHSNRIIHYTGIILLNIIIIFILLIVVSIVESICFGI